MSINIYTYIYFLLRAFVVYTVITTSGRLPWHSNISKQTTGYNMHNREQIGRIPLYYNKLKICMFLR